MRKTACRQGMCCVIKLVMHGPRSHSELKRITGQKDDTVTGTLRALLADELIEPCGERRTRRGGQAERLYRWVS